MDLINAWKMEHLKIQNCNFACCFVWVSSVVSKLRKEHRLRLFKNRVLRKIFGPKKNEVIGEWRRLCNKELYDLFFLPYIIPVIKSQRIRWAGHVAHMGPRRGVYRVLMVRLKGNSPLERYRHIWEDNKKVDLQEVG
jgi:hypothetical protein